MKIATQKDIDGIISVLKKKGYKLFERPQELNIVGMRTSNVVANTFDDNIYVFWKDKLKQWKGFIFPATTDPGAYWLNNPMSPKGSAFLKEGQYVNAYQIGLHQKTYKALVQTGAKVNVVRGADRSALLDIKGKEEIGFFGINIHRASATGTTKSVDKYSAGCQVFANIGDFDTFLDLCEKHKVLYGNKFTYTLIDERAFMRAVRRNSVITVLGIGIIFLGIWYYRKNIMKAIPIKSLG